MHNSKLASQRSAELKKLVGGNAHTIDQKLVFELVDLRAQYLVKKWLISEDDAASNRIQGAVQELESLKKILGDDNAGRNFG